MYRVIGRSSTGKTKQLLTECGEKGIVVCAHPERIADKCRAYNIPIVKAISYYELAELISNKQLQLNCPVYIDELETFVKYLIPSFAGYDVTNEDY